MQVQRIFTAGLLMASLLGALPVRSAENTAAPKETPGVASGASLFTPDPLYRVGNISGPCHVSVLCKSGVTIGCAGQIVCEWAGDGLSHGFVNCDGVQINCPTGGLN